MTTTLVLGGARSGKSRFAESLAWGEQHYIATAEAYDDEMRARIAQHKEQRGPNWTTHEETVDLPRALRPLNASGRFVLVDCLTLWLTNLILSERDWKQQTVALCSVLQGMTADVVLVSNEVGLGIVPENALARQFRDAQGLVNQSVAAIADRVVFIAAGLPLALKGPLPTPPAQQT
jgi:adenosylcobinamide kinase / adenosylcobinamide-phosphate guanylyltransferase